MSVRYYLSSVKKLNIPSYLKPWNVEYPEYKPIDYTDPRVLQPAPWADPTSTKNIIFNQNDGFINRLSFHGAYQVIEGYPINPYGRTGIKGRGFLGKWGPNHAVDILITRFKIDSVLECISIERSDTGKLSFPGGMIDNGETSTQAAIRESLEEIFNISDELLNSLSKRWLERNINDAKIVHQGYVHDRRNTDNSWVESTIYHITVKKDDEINFPVSKGSDAMNAFWIVAHRGLNMHHTHKTVLKNVCIAYKAYF